MRLQSAIFTLPDALLDGGALRPGADKVQCMGDNVHARKENNPDRQLRSQNLC